jgi:hypothetical protein
MSDVDRHTHDRALHPELGEGWAIYDNGAAKFIADSGEVEEFEKVDLGGFGGNPKKSWLIANRPNREQVRLDTTDRTRGTRHTRIVRDDGTAGWLVSLEDDKWGHEFQPDNGTPIQFQATEIFVGRPDQKKVRGKKALQAILTEKWLTMKARSGMFFTYRKEPVSP